ncbi:MAG: branched-chain amino acid ABC transporter permease [Lachnospiraceae bacterium]|nr:branched-chain amino acid ABC transporter permease [Lachnospiraceae bacterium]
MSLFGILYQFSDSFTFLILAALGLAIIFGMMGIINLAQGEFIMVGAYATTIIINQGFPYPVGILGGALAAALLGFVMDRLIISHLYQRVLDSVVATWGISLVLSEGMLQLFGPSMQSVSMPLGSVSIDGSKYSVYKLLLTLLAIGVVILIYLLFTKTEFGRKARATMQSRDISESLGVNTKAVYSETFVIGSALAGLTGALYAPTMTITPTMGNNFMVQSFVTVMCGGANPILGSVLSGGVLGLVNSTLSVTISAFFGKIGLLIITIIIIRVLPTGFTGLIEKTGARRRR